MKNTNPVIDLIRENWDTGDKWGSALNAQFDIAETLYRHGLKVPAHWEYSAGALMKPYHELDAETSSMLAMELEALFYEGDITNKQLIHAGEVMRRLVHVYELEGLNY